MRILWKWNLTDMLFCTLRPQSNFQKIKNAKKTKWKNTINEIQGDCHFCKFAEIPFVHFFIFEKNEFFKSAHFGVRRSAAKGMFWGDWGCASTSVLALDTYPCTACADYTELGQNTQIKQGGGPEKVRYNFFVSYDALKNFFTKRQLNWV